MQVLHFTEETLRTLRCALCNRYLSVSPIVIISEIGQEQKCGRCKDVNSNNKINQRNVAFENLMKLVVFPCIFFECEEKLTWDNVETHETECPHRTIKCPIHSNCNDVVKVLEIESHFCRAHSEHFFRDAIADLSVKFGDYSVALLVKHGKPFVLQIKIDEFNCHFHLFSLFPKTDYYFEMRISSPRTNGITLLYVDDVTSYDERKHCMKCASRRCNEKYHTYCNAYRQYIIKEMITNKIEPQIAKRFLKSDSFSFTVDVYNYDPTPTEDEKDALTDAEIVSCISGNEKLIRQILQCPVCMEYMAAPIFTCKTGHVICHLCRKHLLVCPSCTASFGESRNFALEEMAENSELFCENRTNGCNFVANTTSITQHQIDCEYSKEKLK